MVNHRPQMKKICATCGKEFKTTSKRYRICQPCWRESHTSYDDDYPETAWEAELYGMNAFDLAESGIYDNREV